MKCQEERVMKQIHKTFYWHVSRENISSSSKYRQRMILKLVPENGV